MTFAVGSALSGLAGGLLAPLSGVVPTIGAAYIAKAFITVISGGAAILSGTAIASALLGTINTRGHLRLHLGAGRGGAAGGRRGAAAPAAAGHHRPLLPEGAVKAEVRLLPFLGNLAVLAAGLAVLFGLPAYRRDLPDHQLDDLRRLRHPRSVARPDLGLCRHPVLRPGGLLRPGRLHLRRRRHQHGRHHGACRAGRAAARAVRRHAGLLHVLGPHQRRLSRRHHAHRLADLLPLHQPDRGRAVEHRRRAAGRLQRHSRHAHPQLAGPARRPARAREHLQPLGRPAADRLFLLQDPSGDPLRPHHRGDPRERDPRRAAGLRRPALQARDLHDRRRAGRPVRASCSPTRCS